MSPLEGPLKELDEKYIELIGKFVSDIRNGKLKASEDKALATLTLLEQIISDAPNATAFEMCGAVRAAGRRVCAALPLELHAANMVRRVLRAVRDETRAHAHQSGEGAGESLQRLVLGAPSRRATLGPNEQDLREPIRDHIAELRAELESSSAAIWSQAREHIHAEEVVLAGGGGGALLEGFLRAAAPARYRLVVAGGGGGGGGGAGDALAQSHAMARRLAAAGVPVTVVGSAAVFAVMSRVNKVVVEARAALGGGAALAGAGARALAAAARHHSVPVLALAPLHALHPHHPPCHSLQHVGGGGGAGAGVGEGAPRDDIVPPDHVTLFLTNLGGSSPSYIYRLLSELYDPKDYQF